MTEFSYGDHHYYLIKRPMTWKNAAQYARSYEGYLVHIEDAAEQKEIESQMDEIQEELEGHWVSPSIWIGATDQSNEGVWVWDGDDDGLNTKALGRVIGAYFGLTWTGSAYQNWATWRGQQYNPNSLNSNDDFAAMIHSAGWVTMTPTGGAAYIGAPYQWNDTDGSRPLYFLMELE